MLTASQDSVTDMPSKLTLDQVGALFASGPVKVSAGPRSPAPLTATSPIVYRVTTCELCAGDLFTVYTEDLGDVQVLRYVHASCVDF